MSGFINAQTANTGYGNRINFKSKFFVLFLWTSAVLLQAIWWFEPKDLISGALTIGGGLLGANIFLRKKILAKYPISAVMVLGFTSYYFLMPPLATLIEGKPLTNNLYHPVLVFLHAFLCLLFLSGAHLLYRLLTPLQDARHFLAENIYRKCGFFRTSSNLHLLAMGGLGLLAAFIQIFLLGGAQREVLGTDNKFMQALFPLTNLPFCMLLRTNGPLIQRKWLLILGGYTALLLIVAMARNTREAFLLGGMSIAMAYVYGLAVGLFRVPNISMGKLVIAVICALMVKGPVSDLATSMVIARSMRGNLSSMELISETLTVFQDKKAIKAQRTADLDILPDWDENYIANLFLARLCNLKFVDNTIDLALRLERMNSYYSELELNSMLRVFPRPLIEAFNLPVDKEADTGASGGDNMLYAATGNISVLGGYRVGSILGSGYALFGWWYLLPFAILAMLTFIFADALTSRTKNEGLVQGNDNAWLPELSPMVIITFFSWFFYFTSSATGVESFSNLTGYILRGWLENLIVYAFGYWITYLAVKPFSKV